MFGIDDMIGGLISGGMSLLGSAYTNDQAMDRQLQAQQFNAGATQEAQNFNAQQADLSRGFSAQQQVQAEQFNAGEAEKNRQFQALQSSTAYQRATADMKAAGINPILAYQQGGASTPGGSSASVGAVGGATASSGAASSPGAPAVVNGIQNALTSALEVMRTEPQIEGLKQDVQTKKNQTDNVYADTGQKQQSAALLRAQREGVDISNKTKELEQEVAKVEAEKAKSDLELYSSKPGQIMQQVGSAFKTLNPFVSSAKTLHGMVND